MAEAFALVLLAATLGFAIVRPRGLPEVVLAGPAALLLLATGVVSLDQARSQMADLGPTIGFLAAVLVLGWRSEADGLFGAAGQRAATLARGSPVRLLAVVFVLAAAVTAVLSLDATVVFLTPVAFATAAALTLNAKPHVYASVHLANSASVLLPVSNLTNLLAFQASGLSFPRFGALMALPWVGAIAVEWVVFRRFFAAELSGAGRVPPSRARTPLPRWTLVVLALTLAGFLASSALGVDAAVVAAAGALLLVGPALWVRRTSAVAVVRAADPAFLAFVCALAIVVKGAEVHGLGDLLSRLLPSGTSLPSLLAVAALAALLANLVNNLPAILLLLPTLTPLGAGPVLAALIGVNLGPNLTYVGSLATLLWRRILSTRQAEPDLGEFLRLGAISVPPALAVATVSLWLAVTLWG